MQSDNPYQSHISAALARIAASVGPVIKGGLNPNFNSTYSSLNDVLTLLKPALAAEGLSLLQPFTMRGHDHLVIQNTFVLAADSLTQGASLCVESAWPLIGVTDAHGVAGAITYARRISLISLFALEGIDDDGNSASGKRGHAPTPAARPAPATVIAPPVAAMQAADQTAAADRAVVAETPVPPAPRRGRPPGSRNATPPAVPATPAAEPAPAAAPVEAPAPAAPAADPNPFEGDGNWQNVIMPEDLVPSTVQYANAWRAKFANQPVSALPDLAAASWMIDKAKPAIVPEAHSAAWAAVLRAREEFRKQANLPA